jgi:hypothetical protein
LQVFNVFAVVGLYCFARSYIGQPTYGDIGSLVFFALGIAYGFRLYLKGKGRRVVYLFNLVYLLIFGINLRHASSSLEFWVTAGLTLIPILAIVGASGVLSAQGMRRKADKMQRRAAAAAYPGPRCVSCNEPIESGVKYCPLCDWPQPKTVPVKET